MTASFSWLHLTDLHQGLPGQQWLWPTLRQVFFDDLSRIHDKTGPWDAVLFTGDLTQQGSQEEFSRLDQTLVALWDHVRALGSTPALLAAPGNHDLVRPKKLRAAHYVLANLAKHPEVEEEFWTDAASEYRLAVEECFAPFQAWWKNRSGHLNEDWALRSGLLPGDFAVTIPCGKYRVGVLGLNSAFVQLTGDDFEGKLVLDPRQFHGTCNGDGPRWTDDHDLCLFMTHHPPEWLDARSREYLRSEIDVPGRFVAHMHGHVHVRSNVTTSEGGSASRRRWQGPSLFGLEKTKKQIERIHGYIAGRIAFSGDIAEIRMWARSAVKTQAGAWSLGVDRGTAHEDDGGTSAEPVPLPKKGRAAGKTTPSTQKPPRTAANLREDIAAAIARQQVGGTLLESAARGFLFLSRRTVSGTVKEFQTEVLSYVRICNIDGDELRGVHLELLPQDCEPETESLLEAWGNPIALSFSVADARAFQSGSLGPSEMWSRIRFWQCDVHGPISPAKQLLRVTYHDD